MSLIKSAFTVGFFTLISRILGFIRDIFIAKVLGASILSDAFFVAFRLPNFFRTLSAEGAFNAAFIPLFSENLAKNSSKAAIGFAENVMSFMIIILTTLTVLMEIFMPQVMVLLAPGFLDDPEKFDLTVSFGRIVFPYIIFISLVALLSGILNSFGKFASAAAAPTILNICTITSLWLYKDDHLSPAHNLSYAVLVAGFFQFIWLYINLAKIGLAPKLKRPVINKQTKTLLKRMLPGIIGGGVNQLNIWINTIIATTVSSAVSYLYYADRLVQFPLALIGTAMGTALLPLITKQLKSDKTQEANFTMNKALEAVLLFSLPAAVALFVIAMPLIIVLFERGEFLRPDSINAANALIAYSVGLPAFVMVKVFLPGFFAVGDTRTPVKIALICLFINVGLNLLLIKPFGHVGLAASTSFSAWINISLLAFILSKRGIYKFDSKKTFRLIKFIMSAGFMGLILSISVPYLHSLLLNKVIILIALIIIGSISYGSLILLSKAYSFKELKNIRKRQNG